MSKSSVGILLALSVSVSACSTMTTESGSGAAVVAPTKRPRHDRRRFDEALLRVDDELRVVAFGPRDDAERRMPAVRAAVESNVSRYVKWKSRAVYPAVEKTMGPVVLEMIQRGDGRIVYETNALEFEREPREFARRGWMLLGLIHAQSEVERTLILPLVERETRVEELEDSLAERPAL